MSMADAHSKPHVSKMAWKKLRRSSTLKESVSSCPPRTGWSLEDAGRYLCDFIYYKSLHLCQCPVLFVHVPPLDKPYSAEQLGQGLKDLLEVLVSKLGNVSTPGE